MKGKLTLAAAMSLLALSQALLQSQAQRTCTNGNTTDTQYNEFSWGTINPTKDLIWHECYPGFQCARLEVPLDYSDLAGRKAAIALVRKPALTSPELPSYKGPVLFNPGGPGGSGIDLVLQTGQDLSVILGPHFDVVGFDPRGVGRSTPRASFFETDAERALFMTTNGVGSRLTSNSEEGVTRAWSSSQILGILAADRDDGNLAYMTTPNTARDMLTIVEAHGQEQLQYWGFSYGSVLGATFATMFPEKVKRLVIDGVMDAEDYYTTGWKTGLLDADKAFDMFFTECADAGPDRCALYSPKPEDIRRNVTEIFEKVKREPIPMKLGASYGLVDYMSLRFLFFASFYSPRGLFSVLANAMAKLAAGDPAPTFTLLSTMTLPRFECSCDGANAEFTIVAEGSMAILCNDGAKIPNTLVDAQNYFKELSQTSEWADMWAGIRISCTRWSNPGPSLDKPFEANTSHPILLVGNTVDPVTPLASAKKMSVGFKDSVVLAQDSGGHGSTAVPSLCTQRHINGYFNDGVLPEPGTVCEADGSNFPPGPGESVGQQGNLRRDDGDNNLAFENAVERLSKLRPVYSPSRLF